MTTLAHEINQPLSAIANYIGSFENTPWEGEACLTTFADGSDSPNGCRIASFTSIDLSAKWKVLPKLELSASVQNAFDKIAPLDPLTYGSVGYNPMHFGGAVGRYFTVGVRYDFN